MIKLTLVSSEVKEGRLESPYTPEQIKEAQEAIKFAELVDEPPKQKDLDIVEGVINLEEDDFEDIESELRLRGEKIYSYYEYKDLTMVIMDNNSTYTVKETVEELDKLIK